MAAELSLDVLPAIVSFWKEAGSTSPVCSRLWTRRFGGNLIFRHFSSSCLETFDQRLRSSVGAWFQNVSKNAVVTVVAAVRPELLRSAPLSLP